MLDELRHEIIATQRDTLPPEAQAAVRSGDILAVRAAETAAIVWTLAALDAYTSPTDTITDWRIQLRNTADLAERHGTPQLEAHESHRQGVAAATPS